MNGIKPFSKVTVEKVIINQVDAADNSNENDDSADLSQCQIHFEKISNEKILCDQSLLDQFNFDFKETSDTITITGKIFISLSFVQSSL